MSDKREWAIFWANLIVGALLGALSAILIPLLAYGFKALTR